MCKNWRVTAYVRIDGTMFAFVSYFYTVKSAAETFNLWRTGQFPYPAMLERLP